MEKLAGALGAALSSRRRYLVMAAGMLLAGVAGYTAVAMTLSGAASREPDIQAQAVAHNALAVGPKRIPDKQPMIATSSIVPADEKAEKRRRDEQAEKDRVAAAEAARINEGNCRTDLRCWASKHSVSALIACRPQIERLAKFQFEWTDGWLGSKFGRYTWKDKKRGVVTYGGDAIKFQNGFGAWQHHIYVCTFDPIRERVVDVAATPGRFPE